MKFPARFLFGFVITLVSFLLLTAPSVQAQSSPSFTSENNTTDRDKVFSVLNGIVSYSSCKLVGSDVVDIEQHCPGQNNDRKLGGVLGFITGTIPALYTAPASNFEYTHYLASNFGLAKTTYAQENDPQGFNALSPIMGIWLAVRNLTYVISVVVFILIGFGIMIRFKIDPRTVMTLQNQIPKIIIALILITFSYAIAGLMIDLMWLSTYTGINVLGDTINNEESAGVATRNLLENPIPYAGSVLNAGRGDDFGPFDGIRHLSSNVGDYVSDTADDAILTILFGTKRYDDCGVTNLGECAKSAFQWLIRILVDPVVTLIIFFAVLIALVRIWIMLLKCYIYIIIYTILSPFWILLGLLPETRFGFTNWLKAMTARLLVFPATALLFMAARVFIDQSSGVAIQSGGTQQYDFVPPLVGNPNILDGSGLSYLIAFGIIMLGPELLQILMDAFKTQPFKYTPAITGGFSRGAAVGAAIGGGVLRAGFGKDAQGRPGVIPWYLRQRVQRATQGRTPTRLTNNRVVRGLNRVRSGLNDLNRSRTEYAARNNPMSPLYQQQQRNNQGQGQGGNNP